MGNKSTKEDNISISKSTEDAIRSGKTWQYEIKVIVRRRLLLANYCGPRVPSGEVIEKQDLKDIWVSLIKNRHSCKSN